MVGIGCRRPRDDWLLLHLPGFGHENLDSITPVTAQPCSASLHAFFEMSCLLYSYISFCLGGASVLRYFLYCFLRSCFASLDILSVSYSLA